MDTYSAPTNLPFLTDGFIRAIRADAADMSDRAIVALCDRALAHDADAILAVARVASEMYA